MSADLRTLLQESAPAPREPADVDALFERVDRRRAGRRVAGVAGLVVAVAALVGLAQLVGTQPDIPVIEQDDEVESMLQEAGAFDRGRDETLHLDPDTDQRLHGQVLAEVDGDADAVAVAADGAIGIRQDTALAILVDGQEVATMTLGGPPVRWEGDGAIAFAIDGTLWALDGRTLVGLRRDGTFVRHEEAVTPAPSQGGGVRLRVTGTDVSAVIYDPAYDPDVLNPRRAEVVTVVGQDPLAGTSSFVVPSSRDCEAAFCRQYYVGRGAGITSEVLASGSIVGETYAELDWDTPPFGDGEYSGGAIESPLVAGTAASLAWLSLYDGSFLIVDREDGLTAAALVAGGPHADLSVSPDGAVHVAIGHGDGTMTVRTLLDADLRPLQGQPIAVATDPTAAADGDALFSPQCWDGDWDHADVVVDVDVDGDGVGDRVTRDQDGVIQACLADGSVTALATEPAADSVTETLRRADLAGLDGVAFVVEPASGPSRSFLLRVVDGVLGTVADGREGAERDRSPQGLQYVHWGRDWRFGPDVPAGSSEAPEGYWAFGCRPATSGDVDFELVQLEVLPDTQQTKVELAGVAGLQLAWAEDATAEGVPELTTAMTTADLDQVLRDTGFTPRCLPEE